MAGGEGCPCGGGRPYAACCGPLHDGAPAADAEALMRSRYCAYVRADADYLLGSWHPSTRPAALDLGGDGGRPTWLGLKVLGHRATGADSAEVEFVARYRIGGGSAVRMREHSRFVREDGRWFYLDAVDCRPPGGRGRRCAKARSVARPGVVAGERAASFLAHGGIPRSPLRQGVYGGVQGRADRGGRVLDVARPAGQVPAAHDAVGLHLAQLLVENLLADAGNPAMQLAEADRRGVHLPQDRRLPFAGDDAQRRTESAVEGSGTCHGVLRRTRGHVRSCK